MLTKFFAPKSIAVIGASRDKTKLGHAILANILKDGFKGKVYPVNPDANNILNLKCYPTVSEIKGEVDLAIIITPAVTVPTILIDCGKKGILNVIIISAGFKEVGPDGERREEEIKAISKIYKINILGPNCLGSIDSISCLNASFSADMTQKGKVAFVSQSGAICTAMLDWAKVNNIGFSHFVSLGNKAGITENDILEFTKNDKNTNVVLLYLEGIADGRRLLEIVSKIIKNKPVIILKAGKSKAGQKAIASHTGSLAGEEKVIEAAFKQAGIIKANTLGELFDLAEFFSYQPLIKGNKIAVVANAGGPSVMTADAIAESSLVLAQFSGATTRILKNKLPAAAAIHNPVDLVGDARADRYQIGLEAVLKDKNVDGVMVILTPQAVTEIDETAKVIVALSKKYRKPIATSFIGGERVKSGITILEKNKVSHYEYPEEGIRVLSSMAEYQKNKKTKKQKNKDFKSLDARIWREVSGILQKSKGQVEWSAAEKILANYDLPLVKSKVVDSSDGAVRWAKKLGYPAVLKVVAPRLIHKTDAGGVIINLKTAEEVQAAFKRLKKLAKKYKGHVLVQPMIRNAKEIIFGLKRDPQFGPVIMFGLGGIYVEVLKDVSFRVCPVDFDEALKMISEIKAISLLKGVRGEKSVNLKSIAEIISQLSRLALDFPQIKEMDINPAMADDKGCTIVDLRLIV